MMFVLALFAALRLNAAALFPITIPWNDSQPNANSAAFLNDHAAGSRGYIFVDGAGHLSNSAGRIRFWGTNLVAGGAFPNGGDAPQVAARLAKQGVNVIRFHHMDNAWGGATIWSDISLDRLLNAARLDQLDWMVYQLAQAGIYSNLNLVVSRPFQAGIELNPDMNLVTDAKVRSAIGFFDAPVQNLQKQYATDLLTHVNPYTGHAYTSEPALAFVEINNESGLLQAFKSRDLDALPPYYAAELKSQWNAWLQGRYADISALSTAWNVISQPLGSEKLVNGAFSGSVAPWYLDKNGTPVASAGTTLVAGQGPSGTAAVRLDIASAGQAAWHVQLNQSGVNVTAGQPYTLEVWAKADSSRSISVDLGMAHAPWSGLGFQQDLALTTTWQRFSFVFTPNASDSNARVNFGNMGLMAGASIYFAQVSLKQGGTLGLYPGEALASGTMRTFLQYGDSARTPGSFKDWYRFLEATEANYWSVMRAHLKTTLGLKSLVTGTIIGTSTPNLQKNFDVIDGHAYWCHPEFPSVPWSNTDWIVRNYPMVDNPQASVPASLSMEPVLGKPFSVTEINFVTPNTYEGEGLFITAAYGAFQDWDAIYPFDYNGRSDDWSHPSYDNYFDLDLNPGKMAAFPAAAMIFRRGDVAAAAQRIVGLMDDTAEINGMIAANAWSLVNATTLGEDARAGLVHGLRLAVQGQSAPGGSLAIGSTAVGSSLQSDTGELRWDAPGAGQGVVTMDSPRSKLWVGFLGGKSAAFNGLTLTGVASLPAGGFASLALTSLDGLDIGPSARLLFTALGCQRNSGSTYYVYPNTVTSFPPPMNAGLTLKTQWGAAPALAEGVTVTVQLASLATDTHVYPLNPDGTRKGSVPVSVNGSGCSFSVDSGYATLQYEIVVDHAAYSPTATITATPAWTATPSRTLTPSPTPQSQILWNSFETGGAPQAWQGYADTGKGAANLGLQNVTGTAAFGSSAREYHINTGGAGSYGGGALSESPGGGWPANGYRSLQGMQYVEMWLWTDRPNLRVQPILQEAGNTTTPVNGADGEQWLAAGGAWQVLPANAWVHLVFPLSGFIDNPYWPYVPASIGNNTLDLGAIAWVTVAIDGNQGSDLRLRIDEIRFLATLPTPTPTPSPAQSPAPQSATPTPPGDPGGPLRVIRHLPAPNPVSSGTAVFAFELEGGAASVSLRIYGEAYGLVTSAEIPGPYGAGWGRASLSLPALPNGLYFYELVPERGSLKGGRVVGKLVVLK